MAIRFEQKGKFTKLTGFLERAKNFTHTGILDKYGEEGVRLLQEATPKRTGKTAASWKYKVENSRGVASISFYNTNIQNGVNVAVVLQYGHATKRGGWVEGRDYINPAIQPLFERIAQEAFEELTK